MLCPEFKCKCFKKNTKTILLLKTGPQHKYIHMFVSHINSPVSPLCSFEKSFGISLFTLSLFSQLESAVGSKNLLIALKNIKNYWTQQLTLAEKKVTIVKREIPKDLLKAAQWA